MSFSARLEAIGREKDFEPGAIEVWFADEARVGQKKQITRRWAKPARVQALPEISEPLRLIASARSVPRTARARPWSATLQHGGDEPPSRRNRHPDRAGSAAVLFVDQAGWHLSGRLNCAIQHHADPFPAKCPELSPQKTSGNSCATTGCQTGSSNHSTTSSTIVATLGTSSSTSPGGSCRSAFGIGPIGLVTDSGIKP